MNELLQKNRVKIVISMVSAFFVAMIISLTVIAVMLTRGNLGYNNFLLPGIIIFLVVFFILRLYFPRKWYKRRRLLQEVIPFTWYDIFQSRVPFFNGLNATEKEIFLRRVQFFLAEKTILPIETEIDEECRLLVAASAILPVFALGDWEYHRLSTVLIYPGNFDTDFQFDDNNKNILGMVFDHGSTMILSKPSLYNGFLISQDKMNVGFHEFVHKIDGEDGAIDGLPALLASPSVLKEFVTIRDREIRAMEDGHSDINPYGLTNGAEFFAVVSEYFFENPRAMAVKHPELFQILKRIYKQDPTSRLVQHVSQMVFPKGKSLSKNAPCPCGSGLKYKHCHLKKIKKIR